MTMHKLMAETMDTGYRRRSKQSRNMHVRTIDPERPKWPMIVLRTPKGWTGPKVVDGQQIEGSFRAHQVPITMENPEEHLDTVKRHGLRSYHPEELFR